MKRILSFIAASTAFAVLSIALCSSTPYTRGIGVYPGNPDETFAPQLTADSEYGNIAAFKAAYHSSSYDYNLTAQLATDGVITTNPSPYISVSTKAGTLAKREREWIFDDKSNSGYTVKGTEMFLRLDMANMTVPADQLELVGAITEE